MNGITLHLETTILREIWSKSSGQAFMRCEVVITEAEVMPIKEALAWMMTSSARDNVFLGNQDGHAIVTWRRSSKGVALRSI